MDISRLRKIIYTLGRGTYPGDREKRISFVANGVKIAIVLAESDDSRIDDYYSVSVDGNWRALSIHESLEIPAIVEQLELLGTKAEERIAVNAAWMKNHYAEESGRREAILSKLKGVAQ